MRHKYIRVYLKRGSPIILRDPTETKQFIIGMEVDEEGALVAKLKQGVETRFQHFIDKAAIKRIVPLVWSLLYGMLAEEE